MKTIIIEGSILHEVYDFEKLPPMIEQLERVWQCMLINRKSQICGIEEVFVIGDMKGLNFVNFFMEKEITYNSEETFRLPHYKRRWT
jgi:hypothetical protein